ncbi:hypothetical protein LTS18_009180, partial [Coniosporium uncinatum]
RQQRLKADPPAKRQAVKKDVYVPPRPYKASESPSRMTTPTYHEPSIARTLAERKEPTTLFEAPSILLFSIAARGLALMSYSCAGIFLYHYVVAPPPDLSLFFRVAFSATSAAFLGMGVPGLLCTHKLLKKVTAIPREGHRRPFIRLEAFPTIPNPTGKVLEVPLSDVTIERRINDPRAERSIEQRWWDYAEDAERYQTESMWTKPFSALRLAVKRLLIESRHVMYRENLALVLVKGHGAWGLDVRGHMLEGTKGIDDLLFVGRTGL